VDSIIDVALNFLVMPIDMLAPQFGPAELSALYIMALSLVVILSADNPGKGLVSAGFGFLLAIIGRLTKMPAKILWPSISILLVLD